MPNALVVVLCAVAAASFWTVLGFAPARRLVGPALALPIAPALGWAVHSAAALPILLLAGFSTTTVAIVSAVALAASVVALLTQRSRPESPPSPSVPVWGYLGAAVLALAAAMAIMPKVGIDGIAFAPPIFDHSKVALIDEMTRLGLPPGNPFFGAVGEPASRLAYYYLWHFSAAELALLTGASGWEADIAMTWFTAFSSLALMLGLANWFSGRATAPLWVLLLNAALSCRVVLAGLFGIGAVHQVLMPATGFGGWLFQAAWVPQHIAAASAVVLGLFFLGRLAVERSPLVFVTLVLLAVAGYESSTWIGGVLFPAAAAMAGGMLLIEAAPRRRMSFVCWCVAAAILAICLAWPLLYDQFLATGMRAGGSPIAFRPLGVLGTAFPDGLSRTLDLPAYWLVLLPIEFPAVYVTGAVSLWAYLRRSNPVGDADGDKRQAANVFALLVAASLACAGLFASTIGNNNDLGWRAVLPGVIVLTVFAAVGLARWIAVGARAAVAAAVAAWLLGLLDGLAVVRENVAGILEPDGKAFAQTPEMWAAVRRHAAPDERVANNPLFLQDVTPWPVNLSWALLSDRRSCFAGRELTLAYTALPRARREEIDTQFIRVFAGDASSRDVEELATRYDCRVVVVTAQDGAWRKDPFAASALYRLVEDDARWRIYRLAAMPESAPPYPRGTCRGAARAVSTRIDTPSFRGAPKAPSLRSDPGMTARGASSVAISR